MNVQKQRKVGGFAQPIHHKKIVMVISIQRLDKESNADVIQIFISDELVFILCHINLITFNTDEPIVKTNELFNRTILYQPACRQSPCRTTSGSFFTLICILSLQHYIETINRLLK